MLNKIKNQTKRGFTLIELLVVISIIALLSTVVLGSLNDARERSQWSKFDQEMFQVVNAIQLYRENNNGNWPFAASSLSISLNNLINNYLSDYYNGDIPIAPNGASILIFKGYKINQDVDIYFWCANSDNLSEVKQVFFTFSSSLGMSESNFFNKQNKSNYYSIFGSNPTGPYQGLGCYEID